MKKVVQNGFGVKFSNVVPVVVNGTGRLKSLMPLNLHCPVFETMFYASAVIMTWPKIYFNPFMLIRSLWRGK